MGVLYPPNAKTDKDADVTDSSNSPSSQIDVEDDHKLNVALASLAGFYMDKSGFVTRVDEPRSIPNYSILRQAPR